MTRSLLIALALLMALLCNGQADTSRQVADSAQRAEAVRKQIYSAPRRSSILSAVIPGAGQVYNRSYWKVPILYAGLGGLGYIFYVNHDHYNFYRNELKALYDEDNDTNPLTPYDATALIELKRDYQRNRDLAGLGFILLYLINIVDANVDAHLKTFDVSDDLGIRLSPALPVNGTMAGISIKLVFK